MARWRLVTKKGGESSTRSPEVEDWECSDPLGLTGADLLVSVSLGVFRYG